MKSSYRFFLGTYTTRLGHVDGSCGPGVLACELNLDTGEIDLVGNPLKVANPSFLWLNNEGTRLYAVNEVCDFRGRRDGSVSAMGVTEKGDLELLQQISSAGLGPAYCVGDRQGRTLLTANYAGGSVASFPIDPATGRLAEAASSVRHEGSGPNKNRQEAPHAHSIRAMPGNRIVFAADLGTDFLVAYKFDEISGSLERMDTFDVKMPAGSGPRHMALDEETRILYISMELSSEIVAVSFDESWKRVGDLRVFRSWSDEGESYPSEVLLSKDGEHLYIANRGPDVIGIFSVGGEGKLKWLADCPCGGRTPRHMAFSPDGNVLLVANQDSDSLDSFFRDPDTGLLRASAKRLEVGSPCAIEFEKG